MDKEVAREHAIGNGSIDPQGTGDQSGRIFQKQRINLLEDEADALAGQPRTGLTQQSGFDPGDEDDEGDLEDEDEGRELDPDKDEDLPEPVSEPDEEEDVPGGDEDQKGN